ncbi:hypothetical protein [Actinoallomurus acanthiterrae]
MRGVLVQVFPSSVDAKTVRDFTDFSADPGPCSTQSGIRVVEPGLARF